MLVLGVPYIVCTHNIPQGTYSDHEGLPKPYVTSLSLGTGGARLQCSSFAAARIVQQGGFCVDVIQVPCRV